MGETEAQPPKAGERTLAEEVENLRAELEQIRARSRRRSDEPSPIAAASEPATSARAEETEAQNHLPSEERSAAGTTSADAALAAEAPAPPSFEAPPAAEEAAQDGAAADAAPPARTDQDAAIAEAKGEEPAASSAAPIALPAAAEIPVRARPGTAAPTVVSRDRPPETPAANPPSAPRPSPVVQSLPKRRFPLSATGRGRASRGALFALLVIVGLVAAVIVIVVAQRGGPQPARRTALPTAVARPDAVPAPPAPPRVTPAGKPPGLPGESANQAAPAPPTSAPLTPGAAAPAAPDAAEPSSADPASADPASAAPRRPDVQVANPEPGSADGKKIRTLVVNRSILIGQALACHLDPDRVRRATRLHAAALDQLTNKDAQASKLSDDMIRIAREDEEKLGAPRCDVIETAFSGLEAALASGKN